MDASFFSKLFLSFIVGGCWVTASTVIAEKFGSKIGGLISGIPTTIVVALLFIGLIQGPEQAAAATGIIPAAFAVACIFMLVYASTLSKGLFLAIGLALTSWFLLQTVLVYTSFDYFWPAVALCAATLVFAVFVYENILNVASHEKVQVKNSKGQLLLRAVFAGCMISIAVAVSKFVGPLWGGVFSTFPAMFMSTLIITYYSAGPEFSRSIGKTHMISGVINCVVYSAGVRYAYPELGVFAGTVVAYLISGVSSYCTYLLLNRSIS